MNMSAVAMIAWLAVMALVGFLAGMAACRFLGSKRAQNGRFDI